MNKRKIFILISRFSDNGTRIIEPLIGCYYPHTSIGLEEDLNVFYSFVTKGFIVEEITRYVKPEREPYPCRLYELEVSEAVYNRVKNILENFVENKSIWRYTKLGVALSLLRIPYKRDRYSYFCSQFVADVLQTSGAAKLRKKSQHCFSSDIIELPTLKLQFEGDMKTMIRHYGLMPNYA